MLSDWSLLMIRILSRGAGLGAGMKIISWNDMMTKKCLILSGEIQCKKKNKKEFQ